MPATQLNFYSFFTKYSLLEEYGFVSGFLRRLFRKLVPTLPAQGTVAYHLITASSGVEEVLASLPLENMESNHVAEQLDLSIQAMSAKVVAFGLDKEIVEKCAVLDLDTSPFVTLASAMNALAGCGEEETLRTQDALQEIEALIQQLRDNKSKIGTTSHLTLTTRRLLEYTGRVQELLSLKCHLGSRSHWEQLLRSYQEYARNKDSVRRYLVRHTDLLALQVVEHTSTKGEKYIADDRSEYWGFFRKALLGGGIIALFALLKLVLEKQGFSELRGAFVYGLNYALCFVVVKAAGGVIATKQPAMTASTIARHIDQQNLLVIDSLASVTLLVRKTARSQFISIIGNFLMAFSLAAFLLWGLQQANVTVLTEVVKPAYLVEKTVPALSLVGFAAVAGVFLALSGLISGYVDNRVVAEKIAYRIRRGRGVIRGESVAGWVENKAGTFVGNVVLGFLLGGAFLLSHLLPFPVDIRHIAFSSANVGYAWVAGSLPWATLGWAVLGALLIGLVNFLVSFSITLFLALKSRGARLGLLPKILYGLGRDWLRRPWAYLVPSGGMDKLAN